MLVLWESTDNLRLKQQSRDAGGKSCMAACFFRRPAPKPVERKKLSLREIVFLSVPVDKFFRHACITVEIRGDIAVTWRTFPRPGRMFAKVACPLRSRDLSHPKTALLS
jgi:hypothetical protein